MKKNNLVGSFCEKMSSSAKRTAPTFESNADSLEEGPALVCAPLQAFRPIKRTAKASALGDLVRIFKKPLLRRSFVVNYRFAPTHDRPMT